MKQLLSTIFLAASLSASAQTELKYALTPHFLFGAAVDTTFSRGHNPEGEAMVRDNYNSIVAENCMKPEEIHPEEGRYFWDDADKFVDWGVSNGQFVVGHCLVWHDQTAKWMFTDKQGNPTTREVLIDRMYHHITDVMTRYKGRVKGWDVINEAVMDDGSFRRSPYLEIIGEDYFELAFKFAHAADPDAELYINDYSMAKPEKRATYVRLLKRLLEKGCRIDAIGMQSHNGLDYPDLTEWEKSIEAFAATGVKVMVSELDVNVLPNPASFSGADINQKYAADPKMNPYAKGMDKKTQRLVDQRWLSIFEIIKRHEASISRVTLWGISDRNTWLNDWPIKGRTNYPLLFDRNYKAKSVVKKITELFDSRKK